MRLVEGRTFANMGNDNLHGIGPGYPHEGQCPVRKYATQFIQ